MATDFKQLANQGPDIRKNTSTFEDDGRNYIFPANEVAPGSSFGPKAPPVVTPEDLTSSIETPLKLASLPSEPGEIESRYNVPNIRQPAEVTSTSSTAAPGYFEQAYSTEVDASKRMGNFEKNAYDRIANQDTQALKEHQELQKRQDDYMRKFDQDYKQLSDDVNSKKLDQRRWWNEKSTGDKVLTMVGLALSAVSPTSFQNAMGAIDKTIERDINAQKADIENGRYKLQDVKTLYGENMRRFGDQRVAMAATRMMNADVIKNQLNSQLAGVKGDLAKANGLKMLGQVEQYKQKQTLEIAKLLKDQAKETRELGVPGYKGNAPDSTSARSFRESVVASQVIKEKISVLRDLSKKTGRSISPEAKASAESAIGAIMTNLKGMENLGTLDKGVENLVEKYVNNPTEFFSTSSGSLKKLEEFEKTIESGLSKKAKVLGLDPESQTITSFRPN